MKTLYLGVIVIALLVLSGLNFVFSQTTSSHVMGKFLFSSEIQNLMMRSCGKINDMGDVDPQVIQFVRQNNPKIEVSNDNVQELFWNTLYKKFILEVPEFKSLGGKNETVDIQIGGTTATSCPPIQGGNATFQVNGNQLTYRIGFYSDSQAFYYKSINILHTSQNQTSLSPLGPAPPLKYPYFSKIFAIFQIEPEIVHPNYTATVHILVTNNANFTLYDVNVGESFNDSNYLTLYHLHKIDTLDPNQTKEIIGKLYVAQDVKLTDYYDLWWTVIARNETGDMMESMQFHRNLSITPGLPYYCCDKTQTITLDSPLKQFKSGTDLIDIKCKNGLQLVIRYHDKLPLCVRFEHIHKLMERGLAFLLFARDSQPSDLTVDGLKDSYTIGQPINFTINFKGNSLGCTYPAVFVTASDGMIAWLNYMPVMLCDSDDKVMYRELKWPIGNGELTINDMWDSYRLVVNWNDKVLTKEFGINSRISSVTIPRGFAELKSTFVPQNMTVKIGINDTVRWTNEDNSENLISSDNADEFAFYDETHFGLPLRSLLGSGQSFDYSFLTPGEFGYHSKTRQHGTIKVLPADRPKMQLQIQHPSPPLEHDYSNDRVAVTRGTWVSWDNIDNVTHTITSLDGGKTFDSGPVPPRTRFTLDTSLLSPGYYDYFDKLNPKLSGGIRIIAPTTTHDDSLIQDAKKLKESQAFMKFYPEAVMRVQQDYYDSVEFLVEKQVYPPSHGIDSGTRELKLEVVFDRNHNLKDVSIVCGGPISSGGPFVLKFLESGWCLKPQT